jgi:hypothetical protein
VNDIYLTKKKQQFKKRVQVCREIGSASVVTSGCSQSSARDKAEKRGRHHVMKDLVYSACAP